MQKQCCDTEASSTPAQDCSRIITTHIIGKAEPEPCEVLHSDGADLKFLEAFKYIQVCLAPADHILRDCQGCCCSSCGQGSKQDCSCYPECCKGLRAIQQQGRPAGLLRLLECGPACACSSSCPARTTQQGVSVKLALVWDEHKGWCVQSRQHIPQGMFVAEYVGEYVSGAEAARRLAVYDTEPRGHALMVVRVQLPSQTSCLTCCIDATRTGNVARFINHSCGGGNLEPIITTSRGSILPRVALFAAQDISPGEELAFSYAVSDTQPPRGEGSAAGCSSGAAATSLRPCLCGAAACCGFLPSVR